MRYRDMYSAMATELCDAEVDSIRSRHLIPQNAACTVVPVGFVVHHWNHFFTIIFDYQRGKEFSVCGAASHDRRHHDQEYWPTTPSETSSDRAIADCEYRLSPSWEPELQSQLIEGPMTILAEPTKEEIACEFALTCG
jgi:hypothetical protein